MAITQLNPDTFTLVTVSAPSVAQGKSGQVRFAKSETPADGDWIVLAAGDTIGVTSNFYASGVGQICVLAV